MKKIEMEMSREQAILAQEQNKEVNRQLAAEVKKEVNELLNQREAQQNEILQDNKEVIAQIHTQH